MTLSLNDLEAIEKLINDTLEDMKNKPGVMRAKLFILGVKVNQVKRELYTALLEMGVNKEYLKS